MVIVSGSFVRLTKSALTDPVFGAAFRDPTCDLLVIAEHPRLGSQVKVSDGSTEIWVSKKDLELAGSGPQEA